MTFESLLNSRKIVFAMLLLVTFAVFGNTFRNDWTYDDIPVVVNNPDIRSLENFSKDTYRGRPLRELSYMLDYQLFGDQPAGYRVQQLLWHAANGGLLFLVMSLLGIAPRYALMGSLLFLVHPVQVESVASIGHRKELLPLFFGFLMILAYAKSLALAGWRRWILWLGCLGSYVLVLLGNVTAGPLPLLLPVYELLFVEKQRRLLARYPALCGLALLLLVVAGGVYYAQTFNFQQGLLKMYVQNGFLDSKTYLPMLMVVLKVPILYLGKLLWPTALAPEYVVSFSTDLLQWQSLAGLLLLIGLLTGGWWWRKRLPAVSFAIAWSLCLYVPVANLLPVYAYPMADRYLYMVLPGVAIALAALLQSAASLRLAGLFVAVLVGLSLLTVQQNTHWRNERALWSHAVVVNPDSKGALWSQGKTLVQAGDLPQAQAAFARVLEIDRFYVHAYLELAKIQERQGDLAEARKNYEMFARYGQHKFPAEARRVQAYVQYKFR